MNLKDGMEIHVGVDVGGTFTDLAVNIPGENRLIRHKLPSTPERPDGAIIEGVVQVLTEHGLDAGHIVRLSHGTTVGTNALIQRRVGKVAVVTSQGFRDLLEIGRQVRPNVYDIHTPGAGGYGAPAERSQADLTDDLANGLFSAEFMQEHYGFKAEGEKPAAKDEETKT
jgi:N-methylhydantoinase A